MPSGGLLSAGLTGLWGAVAPSSVSVSEPGAGFSSLSVKASTKTWLTLPAGGIRLNGRHSLRDAFTATASLSLPSPRGFRRASATFAVPAGISLPVVELHRKALSMGINWCGDTGYSPRPLVPSEPALGRISQVPRSGCRSYGPVNRVRRS